MSTVDITALEKQIEAVQRGSMLTPAGTIDIPLPEGTYSPEIIAALEERYLAKRWRGAKVHTIEGKLVLILTH